MTVSPNPSECDGFQFRQTCVRILISALSPNMAEQRHLSHAPITEAVIDVRFAVANKLDVPSLKLLGANIGYASQIEEIRQMQFSFPAPVAPSTTSASASDLGLMGGRYRREDGKYVVQLRNDGMTFSRLPEYTTWSDVFAEAKRIWNIFAPIVRPIVISRVGVRYINRISVPAAEFTGEPARYLTPPPSRPLGVDGTVGFWMTRFLVVDTDSGTGAKAIVTQLSADAAEAPNKYTLIFDIDTFLDELSANQFEHVEPLFGVLRTLKNRIFFSAFTDIALDPYV